MFVLIILDNIATPEFRHKGVIVTVSTVALVLVILLFADDVVRFLNRRKDP